jgi:hypothetical protein
MLMFKCTTCAARNFIQRLYIFSALKIIGLKTKVDYYDYLKGMSFVIHCLKNLGDNSELLHTHLMCFLTCEHSQSWCSCRMQTQSN